MGRLITVLLTLGALSGVAFAASGPISIEGLTVEGWKTADGPKTWVGASVEEKIDGFVDFHRGFNLIDTQWVLLERGDTKLDVFVFTYDTPDNAFGLHSIMRRAIMQAGAESVDIGDEAAFHPMGQLLVWVNRCNVIVTKASTQAPDKDAFLAVAKPLVDQVQGKSQKPELVRALPKDGLDEKSIIYCHYRQALDQVFYVGEENVLGLGSDLSVPTPVEAVFAQYTLAARPHQLIVLRYPEAATAAKAAGDFGALQAQGAKSDTTDGAWRDIEARNGKHTLIYQADRVLAIAPEAVAVDDIRGIVSGLTLALNPPAVQLGGG
jgi:hypothetical protein